VKNARVVIFACFNRLLWISLAKATNNKVCSENLTRNLIYVIDPKSGVTMTTRAKAHLRGFLQDCFFELGGLLLPAAEVQEAARRKTSNRRDRRKRAEGEFV
jgi:hypothetical protein